MAGNSKYKSLKQQHFPFVLASRNSPLFPASRRLETPQLSFNFPQNSTMEFNPSTAITHRETPKKKRRGLGRFFRIALYMLKHSKSHKKNAPNFKSQSLWKNFIHSIRPLCAQNHQPPPLLAVAGVSPNEDVEAFTPPMSQYASASNLQELDRDPTADDDCGGIDCDREGDDMIDAKAEQFIAQFYREIQVQNRVYNN